MLVGKNKNALGLLSWDVGTLDPGTGQNVSLDRHFLAGRAVGSDMEQQGYCRETFAAHLDNSLVSWD